LVLEFHQADLDSTIKRRQWRQRTRRKKKEERRWRRKNLTQVKASRKIKNKHQAKA
jgi:hypothetical protein